MARAKKIEEVVENKVVVPASVEKRDETIKYRCDFKSYEEYNKYKGKKG